MFTMILSAIPTEWKCCTNCVKCMSGKMEDEMDDCDFDHTKNEDRKTLNDSNILVT